MRRGRITEPETATVDLGIHGVKRIVTAVRRAQVTVNTAIRKLLAITTQKWALINELAAGATAMAVSGAIFGDRLGNVFRPKSPQIETPAFTDHLPQKTLVRLVAIVPGTQPFRRG
jgi:hypothetical protein